MKNMLGRCGCGFSRPLPEPYYRAGRVLHPRSEKCENWKFIVRSVIHKTNTPFPGVPPTS
jgi:hypothetical protein